MENILLHELISPDEEDDDDELYEGFIAILWEETGCQRDIGPCYYTTIVPGLTDIQYHKQFRMSRDTVQTICNHLREILPNEEELERKLHIYIWFAGNAETFRALSQRFGLSDSTCWRVVKQMMKALAQLAPHFIKWPTPDSANAREIETAFHQMCRFPGVIGAIDGTLIEIHPFKNNKDLYYNGRKKMFCYNIQAVCDHRMLFTDVVFGWFGSCHDSRLLRNSVLYVQAEDNETRDNLFGRMNYLLGDGGYPCLSWLITPYRGAGLSASQIEFNARLSAARVVIERVN